MSDKEHKVVFRIAKLKTMGNIQGAADHNLRDRPTPNAWPEGAGIMEIVAPPAGMSVSEFVADKLSDQKVRKNAVLAVEVLISASHDYFLPAESDSKFFDIDRLKAWRDVMEPWIAKEFPHAASVVLHLDEQTPHYQIIDVPIDSKGKLNARGKYGGDNRREGLSAWQDKAAEPVKPLGIVRGTAGSLAEHQDVKKYYAAVNTPTPKIDKLPDPVIPGLLSRDAASLDAFAREQRKQVLDAVRPTLAAALAKASQLDDAVQRKVDAERSLKFKDKAYQEQKAIADKVRGIDLIDVLKVMYGAKEAKDSKQEYASRKFKLHNDSEIAVTGNKWVEQGVGGAGGAINLVMHLEGVEYKEAVKILCENFSVSQVSSEHARTLVQQAKKQVQEIADTVQYVPPADVSRWAKVRDYLENVRKLPTAMIDYVHKQGLVYADKSGNAVFPRQKGGAYVRGTSKVPYHRIYGNKTAGAYVLPAMNGNAKVMLCEGPVDALALRTMDPTAMIIATGGNQISPSDLKSVIPPGSTVLAAFDSDERGEELAKEAKRLYGAQRLKPFEKDWAETIAKQGRQLINAVWVKEKADFNVVNARKPSLGR